MSLPLPVLTLAFYTRVTHGLGDFVFDGRHDISAASVLASSWLAGSLLVGSLLVGSLLVGSLLVGSLLVGSLLVGSLLVGSWVCDCRFQRQIVFPVVCRWRGSEFRHVLDLRLD